MLPLKKIDKGLSAKGLWNFYCHSWKVNVLLNHETILLPRILVPL